MITFSVYTFATLLIYRGVNITTVQKLLGHKSVKTTQVYSAVTDLTVEKELKRATRKGKGNNRHQIRELHHEIQLSPEGEMCW